MLEKLLRIRYVYLIAVFFTFLNSIFFLFQGVLFALHGYEAFFDQHFRKKEVRPSIYFVESLDAFLISLVFLIFSLGIMKIFTHYHTESSNLPEWLNIKSFIELKILLWESIIITLVVFSVTTMIRDHDNITWNILISPAVLLALTLSLYLMKKH